MPTKNVTMPRSGVALAVVIASLSEGALKPGGDK
jgi:hypothetical protein